MHWDVRWKNVTHLFATQAVLTYFWEVLYENGDGFFLFYIMCEIID